MLDMMIPQTYQGTTMISMPLWKQRRFQRETKKAFEDVREAADVLLSQCPEEDLKVLREHTKDLFKLAFGE